MPVRKKWHVFKGFDKVLIFSNIFISCLRPLQWMNTAQLISKCKGLLRILDNYHIPEKVRLEKLHTYL
jgi:hypothetical protein